MIHYKLIVYKIKKKEIGLIKKNMLYTDDEYRSDDHSDCSDEYDLGLANLYGLKFEPAWYDTSNPSNPSSDPSNPSNDPSNTLATERISMISVLLTLFNNDLASRTAALLDQLQYNSVGLCSALLGERDRLSNLPYPPPTPNDCQFAGKPPFMGMIEKDVAPGHCMLCNIFINEIYPTICSHKFHHACIYQYLQFGHKLCPFCERDEDIDICQKELLAKRQLADINMYDMYIRTNYKTTSDLCQVIQNLI